MSEPLHTVDYAAQRLGLHPKTILRFIRDGRLKATRVGKSYRILGADIEALAGAPAHGAQTAPPHVTAIVDLDGVGPDLARKWATAVPGALKARPRSGPPMRADIVYEPDRAHLKLILTGTPADTAALLSLVQIWSEQFT